MSNDINKWSPWRYAFVRWHSVCGLVTQQMQVVMIPFHQQRAPLHFLRAAVFWRRLSTLFLYYRQNHNNTWIKHSYAYLTKHLKMWTSWITTHLHDTTVCIPWFFWSSSSVQITKGSVIFSICLITALTSARIVALQLFRFKHSPQLYPEQCLSLKWKNTHSSVCQNLLLAAVLRSYPLGWPDGVCGQDEE